MFGNVAYNILQFIPLKARPKPQRSKKGPRVVPCRWEATAPCRKLRFRDWRLRGAERRVVAPGSCCTVKCSTRKWNGKMCIHQEMLGFRRWNTSCTYLIYICIYHIYIYIWLFFLNRHIYLRKWDCNISWNWQDGNLQIIFFLMSGNFRFPPPNATPAKK